MGDYKKAIIYTIRTGNKLYVGSTTNYAMRKYKHKSQILHNKSVNLYNVIRENNGEWDMKPYSQFPCENRMELHIEEERLRRELNADLNMGKCHRTEKDKKEYFNNYNKNRTIQQKERESQRKKEIYHINIDKERNRSRDKYNSEKAKQYYQKNKENIKIKNNEMIECECGCIMKRGELTRHRKTKKHLRLITQKS